MDDVAKATSRMFSSSDLLMQPSKAECWEAKEIK